MQKYKKFIIPSLAIAGLLMALYMVFFGVKKTPVPSIEYPPPTPPYKCYVAGSGIVEACSRNIIIGVPFTNTVEKIYVKVGDNVKKGTPLFTLDTRTLQAQKKLYETKKFVAEAKYNRLLQMPRFEQVPPQEDLVLRAKNEYENQKLQFELYESIKDKNAVSLNELNKRFFSYQSAYANYKYEKDKLILLNAGSWIYDLNISKEEVKEAENQIQVTQADIDRSNVCAPIDGTVLQINAKLGETLQTIFPEETALLFGCIDPLHIRVNVDETDAWRIQENKAATAFVRGNSDLNVELKFLHIEPYIIPKRSFTGDNTERVDTRVLQIVYEFSKGKLPIYVGQIMDVYIKTPCPKTSSCNDEQVEENK